jgi:multiple antibiotic resistance protein
MEAIAFFFYAFASIFVIVNPVGGLITFISLTAGMSTTERREIAKRSVIEEIKDATKREDISVFPIAMPLLTGPGAITTVIVVIRTGQTLELKIITILAILLTFALSYLIFRFADVSNRILGVSGSLVVTRVMGLLLGAIAVNFIAIGIWNIYVSMI